ncbi:MAG: tetratricopeptide repeat protein [Pseudomonadota bacterium]
MADELKTEEEQLEDLKKWWQENQFPIIAGVVIVVGGLFGWNSYQGSKFESQVAASALYETLVEHVADGRLEEAQAVSSQIAADYANTAYVGQSKLAMARLYMDRNRDEDAATALRELLALDGFDEMKLIANLRLSKILLYQGKADEALAAVQDPQGQAFAARFAEARGDALLALERFTEAREAYSDAIGQANADQTLNVGLVRLKIFDLPPEVTEPDADAVMDGSEADAAETEAEAEADIEDGESTDATSDATAESEDPAQ